MSTSQQKRRDYWANRFPEISSDWPYWWIEGDSYCLAVIDGNNLSAAVEIVEDNWERFDSINAYKAKLADTDLIRKQLGSFVISNRSNSNNL